MASIVIPLPPDPKDLAALTSSTISASIQTATINYNPQNMQPGTHYNIAPSNAGFHYNNSLQNVSFSTGDNGVKYEDLIICQEDFIAELNDLLADMEDEGSDTTPMNIWACSLYNIMKRNMK